MILTGEEFKQRKVTTASMKTNVNLSATRGKNLVLL
jgi:hypothetical protein